MSSKTLTLVLLLLTPIWAQEQPRSSTALHRAALAGKVEAAESALADSDLEALNTEGRTALHLAAKYGHLKMVEFLLEKGAKPDAQGYDGQTPLHLAAEAGEFQVVAALLAQGASANLQDSVGNSALHLGALAGSEEVVAELLKHEAAVGQRNGKGESPLDLAQKGRVGSWRLVVRALEKAAAEQGPVETSGPTERMELPTERLPADQLGPAAWATIEFFKSYNLLPSMTRVQDLQNIHRLREQWDKCYAKMALHATPEFMAQKKLEHERTRTAIAEIERDVKGKSYGELSKMWSDEGVARSFYESNRLSFARFDVVAQNTKGEYATVVVMVPSTDPRTPDARNPVYVRLVEKDGKWWVWDTLD